LTSRLEADEARQNPAPRWSALVATGVDVAAFEALFAERVLALL
jgi:hypothetical protein